MRSSASRAEALATFLRAAAAIGLASAGTVVLLAMLFAWWST